MAKILGEEKKFVQGRYQQEFYLETPEIAKNFCEALLPQIRLRYRLADLYTQESVLVLDTPEEIVTEELSKLIRQAVTAVD